MSGDDELELGLAADSNHTFKSPFYFFPPLVTQRRAFCLSFLKRERIQTVLELGCGEGTLLGLLTNPASCLGEFPSQAYMDRLRSEQVNTEDAGKKERLGAIEQVVRETPALEDYQRDLHLEQLVALDLCPESVRRVHESLQDIRKAGSGSARWEPLRVELWAGDLAIPNARFVGVECVVMSEVVEHLFPAQLARFVPLVFGVYQPEYILITTPNYNFNAHMDQFASPRASARHRFLDPSRQTDRFFRDPDHKFEWTQDEFAAWCSAVAAQYPAYDYEISGCGSYVNYFLQSLSTISPLDLQALPKPKLPVPDSPKSFFATQCVIFKRREHANGGEKEEVPTTNGETLKMDPHVVVDGAGEEEEEEDAGKHELIAVEEYGVDESAGDGTAPPATAAGAAAEILKQVEKYMAENGEGRVRLRDLWLCAPEIPRLCAGQPVHLLLALADRPGWLVSLHNDVARKPNSSSLTGMDAIWVAYTGVPSA
ncbi:hypothetical protein PCANC_01947 [Puccinia coronata f. sp. avenae]|uniref:Small RNA 2'-O-methyltransferase n=1 Tax=Puccinia coronata f. sp. avenae TaxID=200324 RepID=A0A2N5W4G1_9BASI|nr:hypothetical protein PCANC_01947 [Puccinia coronata f. sp. avenae]